MGQSVQASGRAAGSRAGGVQFVVPSWPVASLVQAHFTRPSCSSSGPFLSGKAPGDGPSEWRDAAVHLSALPCRAGFLCAIKIKKEIKMSLWGHVPSFFFAGLVGAPKVH